MGTYFRIIDKQRDKESFVKAPFGSQILYEEIGNIVGEMPCPLNGIPFSIEVDGWGELACIGEDYDTEEFQVFCITEEEFEEATR